MLFRVGYPLVVDGSNHGRMALPELLVGESPARNRFVSTTEPCRAATRRMARPVKIVAAACRSYVLKHQFARHLGEEPARNATLRKGRCAIVRFWGAPPVGIEPALPTAASPAEPAATARCQPRSGPEAGRPPSPAIGLLTTTSTLVKSLVSVAVRDSDPIRPFPVIRGPLRCCVERLRSHPESPCPHRGHPLDSPVP